MLKKKQTEHIDPTEFNLGKLELIMHKFNIMPMQEKNLVQMTLMKWLEFQINMHVQVYYSIVNITFSNF